MKEKRSFQILEPIIDQKWLNLQWRNIKPIGKNHWNNMKYQPRIIGVESTLDKSQIETKVPKGNNSSDCIWYNYFAIQFEKYNTEYKTLNSSFPEAMK